jgi:hypothetical protein
MPEQIVEGIFAEIGKLVDQRGKNQEDSEACIRRASPVVKVSG